MEPDSHLSVVKLRILEEQVCRQPPDPNGTVAFLKDGMLEVLRTAIAAMEALEQR